MQLWLDLIPVVGALLNMAADITNLTIALTVRRDSTQAGKTTSSVVPSLEPALLTRPQEPVTTAPTGNPPVDR